ncbi:hypothetical protein [Spirosoma spitsbergense]|uniref:hypothetical protein n=1 Tax=Spirosoma spitsbergense TaxID=431554 RepID=UPI0003651935|nr:hypothetical protein [Spirosoma spitsbergense]
MNAKNLFTFVAVIVSLFGLGLTFAPDFMAGQYLTNPSWMNDGAKLVAQGWGTTLIAYAAGCWYVRNDGSSSGGKVMLLLVLLSNLALIVIHTLAVLNGVEKAIGWGQVLLSLVLVAWSGMLFRQTDRVVA